MMPDSVDRSAQDIDRRMALAREWDEPAARDQLRRRRRPDPRRICRATRPGGPHPMSEPTDRDAAALRALAADVEQMGRRLAGVETVAADAADEAAGAQRGIARVAELVEKLATR